MNKKSFGLDIGDIAIRAVEMKLDKGGFSLSASITSPTPPKGMMSESPLDEEEMGNAIKKALKEAKIDTKIANVALPENQVYTKIVEMPYLSDRELSSAIYWEAEQYIPIPLSNITLAWNVVKRSEKPKQNEKMNVLMVGAPTIIVKKYQKVLSLSGITINTLETEILSTIRALTFNLDRNASSPFIVVSIGSISTALAIIIGRDLIFTYTLPIGGNAINRAIASDFGLSLTQAEEYKKAYGISNSSVGQRIEKATEPIMSSILTEVKKAVIYFSQKYQNLRIEQIILSGSTARILGIDKYFANGSGIETAVANPWKMLVSQNIPKEILNSGPEYAVSIGLAIKDYEEQ